MVTAISNKGLISQEHSLQQRPNFFISNQHPAEHVFPKKAKKTQKRYMQRNLQLAGGMTMKEWVAQVSELSEYLKDFPTHNRNKIEPFNDNKLLDILEYGVPVTWRREFTVQGFDPVDQG
eukprot:3953066-Ditylum_brightwellii.AAC.1